jgi:hypothetical protein
MANAAGYSRLNRKSPAERAAITGNTLRPIGKTPARIQTKAQAIGTAQMQGRSQAAQLQHQQDRIDSGMQFDPGLAQPAPFQPRAVPSAPLAPPAVPIRPASQGPPPVIPPPAPIPDPITAGLADMDRRLGPDTPAVPGAFPPGFKEGGLYGPVTPPAVVRPNTASPGPGASYPVASQALQAGRNEGIANLYGITDPSTVGPATRGFYDEGQARQQSLAASGRALDAQLRTGQVDERGVPLGVDTSPGSGRAVTYDNGGSGRTFFNAPYRNGGPSPDPTRPASIEERTTTVPGDYHEPPRLEATTKWYDDGRTAPTVVGGSGHRVLRPVDPQFESEVNAATKKQIQKNSLAAYGGQSQRQAAMDAAVAKRQAYLDGGGKTVKDIREGRMAEVQTAARGQAEGRRARLEQRKWNQVPRPLTAEDIMAQRNPAAFVAMRGQNMDAQTAAAQLQAQREQAGVENRRLDRGAAGEDTVRREGVRAAIVAESAAAGGTMTVPEINAELDRRMGATPSASGAPAMSGGGGPMRPATIPGAPGSEVIGGTPRYRPGKPIPTDLRSLNDPAEFAKRARTMGYSPGDIDSMWRAQVGNPTASIEQPSGPGLLGALDATGRNTGIDSLWDSEQRSARWRAAQRAWTEWWNNPGNK